MPMQIAKIPGLEPTFVLAAFCAALLAGCGSGSSSSSSGGTGAAAATTITGTAATGNPITGGTCTGGSLNGVVTLRDSSIPAQTATTATDCNGNYTFNLNSGFHPPFMVEISYQIAGVTYQLNSAGTAADINSSGQGTIDITPLTSLVIANVGHDLATNIFNNANYSTLLTPAALAAGEAALEAQLAPLLTQLGVSTTVDLLHSSFQANGTGIDALLNVLSVNVDPLTKIATITNALNGASVANNLAATTPNTTPISTAGTTAGAVTDLQGVTAVLAAFGNFLATNTTTASNPQLLALFDQTGFRDSGQTLSAFLQQVLGKGKVGANRSLSLGPVPAYATAAVPSTATASYDVVFGANGGTHDFVMYKSSSGTWLILGDQRIAGAEVHPDSAEEMPNAAGNASAITCSGLEFDVKDNGGIPTGKSLSYAIITGPGLPTAGLLYFANGGVNGNGLQLAAGGPTTYVGTTTPQFIGNGQGGECNSSMYWMTDSVIGTLAPGGVYTFTLYYDNGTPTNLADDVQLAQYTSTLKVAPLLSTQLTGVFATNAVATPSLASLAPTGGTTTITWTAPTAPGMSISEVNFYLPTGANASNNVNIQRFASPAATSVQATVPQAVIPSGNAPGMSIWYTDSQGRNFISQF